MKKTQHAVQFVGPDQIRINPEKEVYEVGPYQMRLEIEACGICFSDTKLLHAFDSHPRKSPVIGGLDEEVLAEIPGYQPDGNPTVPGHEPVARIVEVGEKVTHFKKGERVLVQADWKHLPTAKSNAAFGYNFEGALQENVVIDERCVVAPNGDEFLIRVGEEPTAAAIGLIEPWATVEGAYAWHDRRELASGGRLLIIFDDVAKVSQAARDSLANLVSAGAPRELVLVGVGEDDVLEEAVENTSRICCVEELGEERFDDIIYFGAKPETIEAVGPLLNNRATLNTVLGGAKFPRKVKIDVGRIHYDLIRYCGTEGDDPAAGYAWIPEGSDIRDNDRVAIIGAAGPMGLMHTMRAVVLGKPGLSVDGTDLSDDRLAHLREVIDPVARERGVPVRYINTNQEALEPSYDYVVCMVPVPALVSQAVDLAGEGAVVNAFAGIPAGNLAELDLQGIIERKIYLLGTSGSDVEDMTTVVRKIEAKDYDTTISLDAITGIAGFEDAINSVINRTSGGKIMVFPQLHDLPLIRLQDLAEHLPQVAEKLQDGLWTKAAEEVLLS